MSIVRIDPRARYSEAVIVNEFIFMSGMVPNTHATGIREQTEDVLEQIEHLLIRVGSNKSKLLDATIYLADLADYDGMNAVWDAWLLEGCAPARTTVQAGLAKPEWKLEIKMTALV